MQQSQYYMFLKEIRIGIGPSHEDLMLRATNQFGNIKKVEATINAQKISKYFHDKGIVIVVLKQLYECVQFEFHCSD